MPASLTRLSPVPLALLAACLPLGSCIFSETPELGGFSSRIGDPLGALEDEPAPTPPNPLMDPVVLRNGAFNLRWHEDLGKSSNNTEADPDAEKPKPGRR